MKQEQSFLTAQHFHKLSIGTIRRAVQFLTLTIAALVLLSLSSVAQTIDTATMRGQVVDQNRAAIPGATILVTNELTGLRRETRTDDSG
jgi:hypothetical protein